MLILVVLHEKTHSSAYLVIKNFMHSHHSQSHSMFQPLEKMKDRRWKAIEFCSRGQRLKQLEDHAIFKELHVLSATVANGGTYETSM